MPFSFFMLFLCLSMTFLCVSMFLHVFLHASISFLSVSMLCASLSVLMVFYDVMYTSCPMLFDDVHIGFYEF